MGGQYYRILGELTKVCNRNLFTLVSVTDVNQLV